MSTLKRLPRTFALAVFMVALTLSTGARPAIAQAEGSGVAATAAAPKHEQSLLPPVSGEGSEQTYVDAIWVIVIFLLLLAVLYPTAWKNVLAGLKKREERIRGDIADAEAARLKAENTLKDYNTQLATAEQKVRDMLNQAALDAEKIGAAIRTRAQQESEEIKEQALKDIESSKNQALNEIYEQTANLSTSIAEKILRRNLNADDQRDLVNQGLAQIQAMV